MTTFGDITKGTRALARAFSLLNLPGVRVYVIVPLTINLLLFGALTWYGYNQFSLFVTWLMSPIPEFLIDFIAPLLWMLFGVLASIILFFAFTPVANIIAAPFNALMSEKIEAVLTGRPVSSEIGFMKMAIDAISSQLRKLAYIGLWALGLFLVSFIPVINFISPLLWVIFGSWLLSLEYFDYPMGNHDLVFAEQKRRLAERRGLSLGFGGGLMIMTSIPIVNFIAMPVGVAGATLLWVEQFEITANNTDPAAKK